ncbi:flagellar basal body-associated FliL family protein [Marichromatium gracile]|uniref:Flagellar protein FliL n=1 Tax=Marichromatium gracile TaxID=1048 RepID=A0A4R4A5B9_MARGR|nr:MULTISPECIES: flagellar basal body-associated FliL family protein [Marichromatium]MBO8086353.1 flagellar basal body-associated FliL family protein [Marichromatium sp.]MBK1708117.1 flagellar basal body protein FliL [Marichromatium gracile]MCF1184774.1 flagellar basal body-associated FliL family protein [Marichromatium gracile]RNE89647.1 flagellar basal body protein FliL [Marichromatium sp. AB31]RNE94725.1 flagellar basal body protein FliL [Marichromatium sp. AB32]
MAKNKKAETDEAAKPSGKWKLIILILLVVLVLAGGGGAAYFFLMGGDDPEAEGEEAAEQGTEMVAPGAAAPAAPLGPMIYRPLDSMTVNLSAEGPVRFLRVGVTVMTRDEAVAAAIEKHMPMIRNDFLAHLAAQDYAQLNTPEGKDALRAALTEMLSAALIKVGEPARIEGVLFTDLVMQ